MITHSSSTIYYGQSKTHAYAHFCLDTVAIPAVQRRSGHNGKQFEKGNELYGQVLSSRGEDNIGWNGMRWTNQNCHGHCSPWRCSIERNLFGPEHQTDSLSFFLLLHMSLDIQLNTCTNLRLKYKIDLLLVPPEGSLGVVDPSGRCTEFDGCLLEPSRWNSVKSTK